MSVGVAFRAFFAALSNRETAERLRQALDTQPASKEMPQRPQSPSVGDSATVAQNATALPGRSEALTLLSTLQREARWLDLVQEPLDGFSDDQIGAAAREVLKDCRKTLDRMFAIEGLSEMEEGQTVPLEPGASPARIRVVGKASNTTGVIAHRGWRATRCELPKWTGSREDSLVLAPVEIDAT